jgi:predicted deacylase
MKKIEIGTAVADKPGLTTGHLNIGATPDGNPVNTPVMLLRGAEDGPVLWMHACVHGDEYSGTFTIHSLIRSINPADLKGTLVAMPALNLTAFQANQRMSPFEGFNGGDLNRCFPGRENGTVTEQIAYAVFGALKEHADYFVDFHTALTQDTKWTLYADYGGEVSEKGARMTRAFGYSSTLPAKDNLLQGSAMHSAGKAGIPVLIVETGGVGAAFTHEAVDAAAERMRNVMRELLMLDGDVEDYGTLNYFSSFDWICSPHGGLFEKTVSCGETISKGQVIGRFSDVFGAPVAEAHAPSSGIVLAIHPGPVMARGDLLIHIGLHPERR